MQAAGQTNSNCYYESFWHQPSPHSHLALHFNPVPPHIGKSAVTLPKLAGAGEGTTVMGRPTSKSPLTSSLLPFPQPVLLVREKSLSTSRGGFTTTVESHIIISGLALITLSSVSSAHII